MSLRLRLAVAVMRLLGKPLLARVSDPGMARKWLAALCRFAPRPKHVLHLVDAGSPPTHWISAGADRQDAVILYLHGGGYIAGSPTTHEALVARISRLTGLTLACPDYRLAPEHPAPAAFEDAVAAHQMLLAKGHAPGRIVLGGDSAGGGLALALLADLCQRGLTPAGLFVFSPWTDLTMSSDSLRRNAARDPILPANRVSEAVARVRGTLAPGDPRLSPLHASFPGVPPVLIQVGPDEILYDDSRRMAEVLHRAGGQVELQEWQGCPHVWQFMDGLVPEARAALRKVAGFVGRLVPVPSLPPRSGDS